MIIYIYIKPITSCDIVSVTKEDTCGSNILGQVVNWKGLVVINLKIQSKI